MASEKILQAKQQYVDELAAKLEKAAGGVIVDYRGISVADDTVLRKELREAGVEYFVVKNTLLKRAAEKAGITIPKETKVLCVEIPDTDAEKYPLALEKLSPVLAVVKAQDSEEAFEMCERMK